MVPGLSCSAACGIFPDQGSNPCPLYWQAGSSRCTTREARACGICPRALARRRVEALGKRGFLSSAAPPWTCRSPAAVTELPAVSQCFVPGHLGTGCSLTGSVAVPVTEDLRSARPARAVTPSSGTDGSHVWTSKARWAPWLLPPGGARLSLLVLALLRAARRHQAGLFLPQFQSVALVTFSQKGLSVWPWSAWTR